MYGADILSRYTPIFEFWGQYCPCDTSYTCSKKSALKSLSNFTSDRPFFSAYKYIRRYFSPFKTHLTALDFGLFVPCFCGQSEFSETSKTHFSAGFSVRLNRVFGKILLMAHVHWFENSLMADLHWFPLMRHVHWSADSRFSDKGKAEPPCSHTRRFRFPKDGVKMKHKMAMAVSPRAGILRRSPARSVTKSPCNPMWREVRWSHHMS